MKQKSQNRFLAALLAVAMMLQMLPMLAFAEDAETDVAWIGETGYPSLEAAVTAAGEGATITLGEGEYKLYKDISEGTLAGKKIDLCRKGSR